MSRDDAAARVASQLPTRFLRGYAAGKLRTDPVYAAVAHELQGRLEPLLDLGCGVGLLELYLRETGLSMPMTGIDHDVRKITAAQGLAKRYTGLEFREGDVRDPLPEGSNVVCLDVLHYFTEPEQGSILRAVAAAVPPGGIAIIRDAVRDGSLRYRMTAAQEAFSRAIRWLQAERLQFPTRRQIEEAFQSGGFEQEIRPLWGRTPFNNYLFVFRRSTSGMTNR